MAPFIPLPRSSHDGVAHCFASVALRTTRACGAVGSFASLVTRRRRSSPRFSYVANDVCLWRRLSLGFARHMTASLVASLLVRRKRRVPGAPSVPSPRSSYDGVAHCFASLALRTTRACGGASSFASLVTRRRRSLPCFFYVANDVCRWRRPSLSIRSSHDGVARCFDSRASQTTCAWGAVGSFPSLVT